jgi:hypothetical protein
MDRKLRYVSKNLAFLGGGGGTEIVVFYNSNEHDKCQGSILL